MANAITVVNEQDKGIIMSVLGGKMAQDIEFAQLDSAIENIAAHTKKLSDSERESAVGLIDKFEQRVVNAIDEKNTKLKDFMITLGGMNVNDNYYAIEYNILKYNEQYHMLFDSQDLSELNEKLQIVKAGIEAINKRKENEAPTAPFIDEEVMSPIEVAQAKMEYRIEMGKFNNSIYKDEYNVRRDYFALATAVNKNKKIKKFLTVLKEQQKAAERACTIVKEKAEAAKMAILIGDADIRTALQAFHEFANTAI